MRAVIRRDYLLDQLSLMAARGGSLLLPEGEGLFLYRPDRQGEGASLGEGLCALARDGKINEAEDRLFAALEEGRSAAILEGGIRFYAFLLTLSRESLKVGGFTEEEIGEGFQDLLEEFGIRDIFFQGFPV